MSIFKVALVTGASSGIGKLSALGLMKAGFHVVLAGRRIDALNEVAASAHDYGVRALAVATPARSPLLPDVPVFVQSRADECIWRRAIEGLGHAHLCVGAECVAQSVELLFVPSDRSALLAKIVPTSGLHCEFLELAAHAREGKQLGVPA